MKIILYIVGFLVLSSWIEIPKVFEKKIDKEVLAIFEIQKFDKQVMEFDEESLSKFSASFDPSSFFVIANEENRLGYFYYGKAKSKADDFDYVVIFDRGLIVKKIKILAYREDYGGEITSKRWLRQFAGLTGVDEIKYGTDIKAISGATISAVSMTDAVNDLLKNVAYIQTEE